MEPSSSSSTDPLKVFYDSLTKEIDDLETMLQTDNNNFMSIQFLERVLSLTRFCNDRMTHLAQILKLPAGCTWLYQYMVESEKLTNASKDIKVGVGRMEKYYFHCVAVTKFLDTNRVLNPQAVQQMITAITDCTQAAEKLEKDNIPLSTKWKDLRKIEVVSPNIDLLENYGFDGVIYATRNVSKTLLRILMYGLVYCLSQYKFDSYVYQGGLNYDSSFMVSTDKLQQSVESEIYKLTRRTGILWYEFRESKVALDKLLIEFERALEGGGDVDLESEAGINEILENLKRNVEVLKEGSERIIKQIDDFNDEIIEAKNKMFALP